MLCGHAFLCSAPSNPALTWIFLLTLQRSLLCLCSLWSSCGQRLWSDPFSPEVFTSALGLCLGRECSQNPDNLQGCPGFALRWLLAVWSVHCVQSMWSVHHTPQGPSRFQALPLNFRLFLHCQPPPLGPQPLARRPAAFSWRGFSNLCSQSRQCP